VRQLVH
jgi:hypothetical protein